MRCLLFLGIASVPQNKIPPKKFSVSFVFFVVNFTAQ